MAKSRQIQAIGSGQAIGSNSTQFHPVGNGTFNASATTTTEVNAQVLYRTAGTLSNAYLRVTTNNYATTLVWVLRKNAVNGNLTMTIGIAAIGVFEDTTHTDTIAAGDKLAWQLPTNSAVKTITLSVMAATFDATSTTSTRCLCSVFGVSTTAAAAARFEPLQGKLLFTNATEANAKTRIRKAGSWKNLCFRINSVGAATCTIKGRINGADGTQTITTTSATANWYEDTTHVDALAVADDVDYSFTYSAAVTTTLQHIASDFQDTTGGFSVHCNADPTLETVLQAVTTNYAVSGGLGATTTEANVKCLAKDVYTASQLTTNVTTNTVTAASNIRFRDSGVNGTQVATITASTTGIFSDTTHTDALSATDDMNYQLITGTGGTSLILSFIDCFLTNVTSVAITKALTETITIGATVPTKLKGSNRTATETITISSPVARLSTKNRAIPAETITISSTPVRVKGKVKTLTETITIATGSLALLRNKIRTATETITISSPVARLAAKNRALATQTVTISDAVARIKGVVRTVSQTVTISEALTRLSAKIRARTETVTISSTVARIKGSIRTITQTVTISDAVARLVARAIAKTLTETVTISSTVARLAAKTRTRTETITISSTPARLSTKVRALTETVALTSTVTRIKGAVKTLTETVTISSTVARLAAKIRTLSQTITISDSVARVKSGAQLVVRTLTETITISSTVTRLGAKKRPLTETIAATSTPSRLAAKNRALSPESITIGAGIASRTRGIVRTLTDTLSAISTLSRLSKKIRTLQQTITITDQVTRTPPGVQAKQPPGSTQSVLAQELRHLTTVSKDLQRFLLETVHLQDHVRIDVKRYSKVIRTARVKKIIRILDLVKLADDIYNKRG